jgi:hypothetical protein
MPGGDLLARFVAYLLDDRRQDEYFLGGYRGFARHPGFEQALLHLHASGERARTDPGGGSLQQVLNRRLSHGWFFE